MTSPRLTCQNPTKTDNECNTSHASRVTCHKSLFTSFFFGVKPPSFYPPPVPFLCQVVGMQGQYFSQNSIVEDFARLGTVAFTTTIQGTIASRSQRFGAPITHHFATTRVLAKCDAIFVVLPAVVSFQGIQEVSVFLEFLPTRP